MGVEHAAQAIQDETYRKALVDLLFQLADDDLFIGHRDSEWLGLAPGIEEDVAFSSVAQDEVGHGLYYLERLTELGEQEPNALAFTRQPDERRNAVLLERPNGDWAYTIARHFFYDLFDDMRLEALSHSSYPPLAQAVAKIKREEYYHLLHFELWFTRLGVAGGEAQQRMEAAVDAIWPEIGGLFSLGVHEELLVKHGIIPIGSKELRQRWEERVRPVFDKAGLTWPGEIPDSFLNGREGQHTEQCEELIQTMSEVYRLDPTAKW